MQHPHALNVSLGRSGGKSFDFVEPFRIGRTHDCEVCVENDYVSRVHAEVVFENGNWCIHDRNSSNGIYVDGKRVKQVAITKPLSLKLGVKGPEIFFEPLPQPEPALSPARAGASQAEPHAEIVPVTSEKTDRGSGTVIRHYVDHYFRKSDTGAPAGEHTMYVRRAFAAVQKQQKRRYAQIIGIAVAVALVAAGYAFYEHRQLQKQRALAEDLFYTMMSLDLDIANLEKAVAASGNQQDLETVRHNASRRREMQSA